MSSLLRRKDFLLVVVAFCFGICTIPYFLDVPVLDTFANKLSMIVAVQTCVALVLSLYSQTKRNIILVNQRTHGWPYRLYEVAAIYVMIFLGLAFGQSSQHYQWIIESLYISCDSVIYSILAFYMASAGARAFRARSPQAALLLIVGVIVLMGQAPVTGAFAPWMMDIRLYFTSTFATAGARMFTISVTVGAIVLGVRMLLGKEAAALGIMEEVAER